MIVTEFPVSSYLLTKPYRCRSRAIDEMLRQSREVLDGNEVNPDILPVGSLPVKHQIAFNAIPQIDKFQENGYTNGRDENGS